MRVLITGITGFVGSHLADFLSAGDGVEVYGLARRVARGKRRIYSCDIADAKHLEKLVRFVRPERIFHLAAQAGVPASWEFPAKTFEQNITGTVNLLEAVRKHCPAAIVQLTGSAHEYGIPPKNIARINETVPMNPMSPYAVSKIAQDRLAELYFRRYQMNIVRTRGFNQIGPRQSADFVTASLARQIALIEAGRQKPQIMVGNLDSVRDYADVRDMVRAYWLALEKGKAGEVYNIATGRGHTVAEVLDIYLKFSHVKIQIKKDPKRLRAQDLPRLVGNPAKFMKQTGWRPRIRLKDSLCDILNDWRYRVTHG